MLTFDYIFIVSLLFMYIKHLKKGINYEKSNRQSGKPWTCSI